MAERGTPRPNPSEDSPSRMSRPERAAASRFQALLDRLPQGFFSRTTQFTIDAAACAVALYLAYQLRFDSHVPPVHAAVMWAWMLVLPVVRPALMWALGGYDRIWRYFNLHDGMVLAITSLPPTIFMALVRYGLWRSLWVAQLPVSVIVMEYLLFLGLAGAMRGLRRVSFEASLGAGRGTRLRALIIGTEDSLPAAVRHISTHAEISVVGLLAPDAKLHGLRIGGCWVLDEPAALGRLLTAGAVDLVLIADAGLDAIGDMVATATEFGVDVRLLPSAQNVLKGDVRVSTSFKPEEVLQDRAVLTEVHPNVAEAFRSRVVLITGAGGSIGSELARQTAALPVASVLLLDQDENSIFEIHNELKARADAPQLFPLVGDVRDRVRLQRIFEQYRPHIVLHAAAYKHVPVMEENCCEAVLNNVFGTREVAAGAIAYHAERFLMISTDKAVLPTSIMGASKRIAELLVQSQAAQIGRRRGDIRMACVRFGNVVGSRGSVVPIFLRQIAAGEPLTITDPEMTRYFMTIPEAVQLVLQASTLGSRGEIYMLDMGDPVKITALARKLVEMSGLRPDKDVEIRFVGARPGEKLFEKLWADEAKVSATEYARVMSIAAREIPADFEEALERLEAAALAHDEKSVRALLETMPIGFRQKAKAAATE